MNQTDTLALLSDHYLFSPLEAESRQKLLKNSHIHKYPANSLVFQKDESANHFFVILRGSVRLYFSSPDGKEKTVRIFSQGSSFAEALTFMRRDSYPANAMTMEESELLAIDSETYRNMLAENPDLAVALLAKCCEHIHMLSRQIEMLSVLDARSRLLEYLRQQLPDNAKDGVKFPIPMNKKELAEFLAIRPETLSRLLRQLENEHILHWQQNQAEILNLTALKTAL